MLLLKELGFASKLIVGKLLLILFICGTCIYQAAAVDFVVHPKSATVSEGNNITLNCKFNEIVEKCIWSVGGSIVDIGGRCKYSDPIANGKNTSDCSIQIQNLQKCDEAKWQCLYSVPRSYVYYDWESSNAAWLTFKPIRIEFHPHNATVSEGENVIIPCKFSKAVERCVWFRGINDSVPITGRYKYLDPIANGTNTSDCSIQISNFQWMDDGPRWQCSCDPSCLKSNVARLTLTPSTSQFVINTIIACFLFGLLVAAIATVASWGMIDDRKKRPSSIYV